VIGVEKSNEEKGTVKTHEPQAYEGAMPLENTKGETRGRASRKFGGLFLGECHSLFKSFRSCVPGLGATKPLQGKEVQD